MSSLFHGIAHQNAKKIQSRTSLIAPERAQEILSAMPYQHQRAIRQEHVLRLASDMREGRFAPGTPIRIAHCGNESHLIDGQHRLAAVVKSQTPIVFTVIEEATTDEEYLAWVYGKTDTGQRRSIADLYRTLELTRETGLSSRQINKLSGSVELFTENRFIRPIAGKRLDDVTRIALLRLYAPWMLEFGKIAAASSNSVVRRATERSYVIAVAMVTLRYRPKGRMQNGETPTVEGFWWGALSNDGLRTGDPRKFVYEHLMTTRMTQRMNIVTGSSGLVDAEYGARYLISAFNKYMRHEDVKLIKVIDSKAPVKIEGIDPALDWTA
jgi:hypothetical protein